MCLISTATRLRIYLGADIDTTELSTVELGVGILSSCLPACRPLFNHIFLGRATANVSNQRSRDHGSNTSSGLQSIRLAVSRSRNEQQSLGSQDDEESRLYNGKTMTSVHAGDDRTYRTGMQNGKSIGVTRQFATSTTIVPRV